MSLGCYVFQQINNGLNEKKKMMVTQGTFLQYYLRNRQADSEENVSLGDFFNLSDSAATKVLNRIYIFE